MTYYVLLTRDESLLVGQRYVHGYYSARIEPFLCGELFMSDDVKCFAVENLVETQEITMLMLQGKVIAVNEEAIGGNILREFQCLHTI